MEIVLLRILALLFSEKDLKGQNIQQRVTSSITVKHTNQFSYTMPQLIKLLLCIY